MRIVMACSPPDLQNVLFLDEKSYFFNGDETETKLCPVAFAGAGEVL